MGALPGGHPAGGSRALGELIDAHGAAIAADLLHHYGFDLRSLCHRDSASPRWVLALIEHLPEGCATAAAVAGGPEHRGWSVDRHLLAALVDAAQAANWQRGGGRGARPRPVPRPGARTARRVVTVADLARRAGRRTPAS